MGIHNYQDLEFVPDTVSATTYTLVGNETFIIFTSNSAVTLTVDTASIVKGYYCTICQYGTGQISFAGTATRYNADGHTKTWGQYAIVTILGTADGEFVFTGRTA